MDLNLQQLRVFQAVAAHGSFSRAAVAMYLSQPGVSLQMKALERTFGAQLFEKAGRGLKLTEAGEELLRYSERIFALLDETKQVMEELAGGSRGTVNVGASTTAGIYVVPPALGAYHRAHPDVTLTLDVLNRHSVQRRLLENQVDLAVMGLIEDPQDLEVAQFVPNELVVIASPRHPLAGQRGVPLATLAHETFLVREAGSGTRIDTVSLFEALGVRLRIGMELRSSGAIKQGVAADLGIGVIPRAAIELELAVGKLCVLDVLGFPVRRDWYLVRPQGRRAVPAAAALWNFLIAYRDEMVRSDMPPIDVARFDA